ncbi:MAG TPA: hypothetical protein VNM48_08895 [Chloroflexota bacterium]|nr:hypothetical protein [Chloroflexota bacterium]
MTLQELPDSPKRWGARLAVTAVRLPETLPKSAHMRETGSSTPFTESEDRTIREERAMDAPYRAIARQLGRTYSGVRNRHYQLLAGKTGQKPASTYSRADDALILDWHTRGKSNGEIGHEIGKSGDAVRRHIRVLKRQTTQPQEWLILPTVTRAKPTPPKPFTVAEFQPSNRATGWQSQTVPEWMDWLASASQEQRAALVAYGRSVLAEQLAAPAAPLWPVAQLTMHAHEPMARVKASARARQ